uniref:RING-type domain-containing protein n=1 Tax=Callorhinchus milii TaxID=7868 RepID=A0A4W3GIG3_CALMI
MASEQELENLRNEATCSICLEFYTEPVTIDCGHNFCRGCILQCWGTGQESVSCPQCRQQIPQRGVRPNRTLSRFPQNFVSKNMLPDFTDEGLVLTVILFPLFWILSPEEILSL